MQSNIFLVYGTAKPRDVGKEGGGRIFLKGAFDWEIWISILKSGFRICNRTRNPKTDFNAEISVFGFSFLPFDWEIRKRI